MVDIKYDKYGGIVNLEENEKGEIKKYKVKNKKGYNFFEKIILKYSRKVNYLLDENGRYKCRQETVPEVIRIGPTNRCTARCFYCPREYVHNRGTGYMDFNLYENIIRWAKDNKVKTIAFALFGEPFLHPRIIDMLDLAHSSGLNIRLSTNGIILTKELANNIFKYNIEGLEVSMDGFTEDEYKKGKQVDKLVQAKNNVLYLLSKARKRKVKTIFNIHFVDIGNVSFSNKINYIKFWKKKLESLNHLTSFCYEPHNWAGAREDLREKMGLINRVLSRWELKKPCVYIRGLNINWNGDILICANDPTERGILGNINNSSIEEIYNGEKRIKYLLKHEQGSYENLNCQNCTVNSILPLLFIKKRIVNKIISLIS